ncbi:tyrosine-protein phosphatase [bacterium]|nr:tyrosine-protein phosphatase [candidate division CSSED10-310 bacterium]
MMIGVSMIHCQSTNSCGTCEQTISANNHNPAGVPLFAKVSDSLYRGAQPTEKGFVELKKMGIRTIVTLRVFDTDKNSLPDMNFRQFHISCKTLHPEEEDVIEFLRIVTDPANQPVFVHCREGIDRTGMMVAMYRMVIQDWPREKALAEMKAFGFHEIWNPLEDYIEKVDVAQLKSKLHEP